MKLFTAAPDVRSLGAALCACVRDARWSLALSLLVDFQEQRALASEICDFYDLRGAALFRLIFEVPLQIVHLCSGAGGSAAGVQDLYKNLLTDIETTSSQSV